MYFVVADLAGIDVMYQYSLDYFLMLFEQTLETSPQPEALEERMAVIESCATEHVFTSVCDGLFERHKLLFRCLKRLSHHMSKH